MEEKYKELQKVTYGDGYFSSGSMTGSKHPENTVYLDINRSVFEFTEDEMLAVAKVAVGTIWQIKSGADEK